MDIYRDALILMIILLVVLLLTFVLTYRSHKKIQQKNKSLLEQWTDQHNYIKGLESFSRSVWTMTEDLRKLTAAFETGNRDTARHQAEAEKACLESCNALLSRMHSGNPVADALLFGKTSVCQKLNIRFEVESCQLPEGKLKEIELTSLLSNLLDNAIEAAAASGSEDPFIRLNCNYRSGVLFVRVENSKDPSAMPMKNQMHTTKKDKSAHGLGLQILNKIIEKYDGVLKMEDKGSTFISAVSLVLG